MILAYDPTNRRQAEFEEAPVEDRINRFQFEAEFNAFYDSVKEAKSQIPCYCPRSKTVHDTQVQEIQANI